MTKPHITNWCINFFLNLIAAQRHPYKPFISWTYNTGCPFSWWQYSAYRSGSHSINIAASVLCRTICITSSWSPCINAPGMSAVYTARHSQASITAVKRTDSMSMVGDADSALPVYRCCGQPSAQPQPLITPDHFSFKNIKYSSTLANCSLDKPSGWTGFGIL